MISYISIYKLEPTTKPKRIQSRTQTQPQSEHKAAKRTQSRKTDIKFIPTFIV